jgi:hypothetical protein
MSLDVPRWFINRSIQGLVYRLSRGNLLYVGFPKLIVKRPWVRELPLEIGHTDEHSFFQFRFSGMNLKVYFDPELQRDARQVIQETFSSGVYDIDVVGRDVVDIGSNIGDTAIYFALKGAKRVIALEPYPSAYQIGRAHV